MCGKQWSSEIKNISFGGKYKSKSSLTRAEYKIQISGNSNIFKFEKLGVV